MCKFSVQKLNLFMAAGEVSLKLLVDTKEQKVLFAEGGKEFVDFLFHVLSLPLATVIRLLSKSGMVGCLRNLYESVENLTEAYLQPNQNKNSMLNPKVVGGSAKAPLLLLNDESPDVSIYVCSNHRGSYSSSLCRAYFSFGTLSPCPGCKCPMKTLLSCVASPAAKAEAASASSTDGIGEGGFVKGVVTYMVMDDLVVKPMSAISSITLLNKFNINEISTLQEKVVYLTMDEGVNLLKASLQSTNVLTDVFLAKAREKKFQTKNRRV